MPFDQTQTGPSPAAAPDPSAGEPTGAVAEAGPVSKYWAAKPKEEIGTEIADRCKEYYQVLVNTGVAGIMRNAHAHFYSLGSTGHEGSKLVEFGDDGEKLGIRSNQLRSLVRYMLISTTGDRPAILPKAINASAKAMSQVPTARRTLDYYMKKKGLERKLVGTALRALIYGKGYLWAAWDQNVGPKGDVVYRAESPLSVAIDLERESYDNDWYVISRPRNRYDLAAVYGNTQELYDEIVGTDRDCLSEEILRAVSFGLQAAKTNTEKDSDVIYERHFIHRKTPALPDGRYTVVIGEDRVILDGPLPYKSVPVFEMVPEEFLEAEAIGYASSWDLIGLQDAYDGVLSTCITNFDAFGHNDMLLPDGVELSVEYVREGLNAIRYPMGEANKPSMLEKFSIPEEVFKLQELLRKDMETNSGVNSVARGDPQSSLQTGPALALVQAQAVQFQSAMAGAYVQLIEEAGTGTLHIIQEFVDQETLAMINGPSDADGLLNFQASAVDLIDHVECEQGPAIARTMAGKVDMANMFLEQGLITSVNQYFEVLETGRLEPVTDPSRKAQMQVDAENELLMQGPAPVQKPPQPGMELAPPEFTIPGVPVVMTDHPVEHIMGHTAVLNSPENRKNPAIIKAVTQHILEHISVWRSTPPDVLMLLDYPLPGMPGAPSDGGGAQAPEAKKGKKSEKDKAKAEEEGGAQPPGQGSTPGMPRAPETDKFGNPTH